MRVQAPRQVWMALVTALLLSFPAWSQDVDSLFQGEAAERFLREGEIVASRPIGSGVTDSLRLTLELDGQRRDAAFKTIDRREPGNNRIGDEVVFGFQDSYRLEIAAYVVDRMLGLGMVPATIERSVDGRTGSIQLWANVQMSEADRIEQRMPPKNPLPFSRMGSNRAAFDQLIANNDRHLNNLLIDPDWNLVLIDHSRSFFTNTKPHDPGTMVRFSRALLAALENLDVDQVESRLDGYLTNRQVATLFMRRDLILEWAEQLVRDRGEEFVLFP